MGADESKKPEQESGLSTRGAWLAGLAAVLLVAFAAAAALSWPEIELRYHRHRFRHGTLEERLEAFEWIRRHRLKKGMTKEAVEQILGEPLGKKFQKDKSITFTRWYLRGSNLEYSLCFEEDSYLGYPAPPFLIPFRKVMDRYYPAPKE